MNKLLKFWAYLFHFSLSAVLLAIAVIAVNHHDALRLEMLPFDQDRLVSRISIISLVGFLCLFLAFTRIFEIAFPVWSLVLIVLFIWGFFFTSYSFQGPIHLPTALLLILAAALALYGSFMVLIPERRNRW